MYTAGATVTRKVYPKDSNGAEMYGETPSTVEFLITYFRHGEGGEAVFPEHSLEQFTSAGVHPPLSYDPETKDIRIDEELILVLAASIIRRRAQVRIETMSDAEVLDSFLITMKGE